MHLIYLVIYFNNTLNTFFINGYIGIGKYFCTVFSRPRTEIDLISTVHQRGDYTAGIRWVILPH